MPFLPDFTEGPLYGLISDTFKPINPIVPPDPTITIYLTTSQDSWGGKERDVMNNLAYFPNPSFVPLLVGMYNGEIIVDEASIERAAANNGFDNKTGAIVVPKDAVIDFVIKNQVGGLGISVPHPVFFHKASVNCSSTCTAGISGTWELDLANSRSKHGRLSWLP